jgi:hypothetical protein
MLLGAGVKAEAVASDGTHECALHLVADVRSVDDLKVSVA